MIGNMAKHSEAWQVFSHFAYGWSFFLGKVAANVLAFPTLGKNPMGKIAFWKLVNVEDLLHGRNEVKEDDWTSSLQDSMHIIMGELGARL